MRIGGLERAEVVGLAYLNILDFVSSPRDFLGVLFGLYQIHVEFHPIHVHVFTPASTQFTS